MTITGWEDRAACRTLPENMTTAARTEWWNPGATSNTNWEPRRAICRTCPVAAVCLADALNTEWSMDLDRGRYGMRGGHTPTERIQLAQRHRGAA